MDFEKIAELAYKGEGINDSWDLPVRYTYLRLEKLYHEYKIGAINKEKSIVQKAKIAKEFKDYRAEYDRNVEINREYNQSRADNTMLLIAIEKSTDVREMLEFALKIIANNVKDDSLVARNLEKIVDCTLN